MTRPGQPADASFEHDYRVRFDEAGPDGLLRTSGLLRYAQDVAWIHSEALGFDRPWYEARGLAWLVRAASVRVDAPIPMGREVRVTTTVVGFRKVWARRRGDVRLADGTLAAEVQTDWVLINHLGAPTRIPPEFGDLFPSPPLDTPISRVDLVPAPPDARLDAFRVRPHELDPNDHANNAAYVDWLEESIIGAGGLADVRALPRRYTIEFAAAARGGVELEAATWRDEGGWGHRLRQPDGAELVRARLG